MFEKKCCNGGTKHKFKPRYTEKSTGLYPTKIGYVSDIGEIRKLMIHKEYVCDICEWCGECINRRKQ